MQSAAKRALRRPARCPGPGRAPALYGPNRSMQQMLRFWEGRIWFRCFPARNRDWAQRPKNPCFIGRARRDPEWAVLVTIKFPGAARTLARRLEDRAFAASRVADDRTMRTQNTPVIAAQAAAARDWTVSRIWRKPSSGAMHIVRYVFRKGSHRKRCSRPLTKRQRKTPALRPGRHLCRRLRSARTPPAAESHRQLSQQSSEVLH
jgi:hypothetical protein